MPLQEARRRERKDIWRSSMYFNCYLRLMEIRCTGFLLFFFVKELMGDQNTDVANFLMKALSHPGHGKSKCCIVDIDEFPFLEDVSLLAGF